MYDIAIRIIRIISIIGFSLVGIFSIVLSVSAHECGALTLSLFSLAIGVLSILSSLLLTLQAMVENLQRQISKGIVKRGSLLAIILALHAIVQNLKLRIRNGSENKEANESCASGGR